MKCFVNVKTYCLLQMDEPEVSENNSSNEWETPSLEDLETMVSDRAEIMSNVDNQVQ